jgi:hypothetical protein
MCKNRVERSTAIERRMLMPVYQVSYRLHNESDDPGEKREQICETADENGARSSAYQGLTGDQWIEDIEVHLIRG